ncbi:hypothetical protein CPB84DRAFT_1752435 [Gymnopilus junonius]|uniref:Uncharacterized protein n=1 Tax=Gymnopilus junonius TaxID=109634 RepID=A0A9P5THC4_GYMJU|nr:hypothetical protein CPB84DRAFT_1752435 [Gymnopilus junonius]
MPVSRLNIFDSSDCNNLRKSNGAGGFQRSSGCNHKRYAEQYLQMADAYKNVAIRVEVAVPDKFQVNDQGQISELDQGMGSEAGSVQMYTLRNTAESTAPEDSLYYTKDLNAGNESSYSDEQDISPSQPGDANDEPFPAICVKIPKPNGEPGRPRSGGYNLDEELGAWDADTLSSVNSYVKAKAKQILNLTRSYSKQDPHKIAEVCFLRYTGSMLGSIDAERGSLAMSSAARYESKFPVCKQNWQNGAWVGNVYAATSFRTRV